MGSVVSVLTGGLIGGPEEPKPLPPPPPPPEPPKPANVADPSAVAARKRERTRQRISAGRPSTIRTNPQGLPSAISAKKTALGV